MLISYCRAVSTKKLGKLGSVVRYTFEIVTGGVPADSPAFVVTGGGAGFPKNVTQCTNASGTAVTLASGSLTANTAYYCSFDVAVTLAHIHATELPAFGLKVTINDTGTPADYLTSDKVPAEKLYTTPSITMVGTPAVNTANTSSFVYGEPLNTSCCCLF